MEINHYNHVIHNSLVGFGRHPFSRATEGCRRVQYNLTNTRPICIVAYVSLMALCFDVVNGAKAGYQKTMPDTERDKFAPTRLDLVVRASNDITANGGGSDNHLIRLTTLQVADGAGGGAGVTGGLIAITADGQGRVGV